MSNRQPQGNGKSEEDFLIVNRTDAGYRVYPASQPSRQHLVSGNVDDPACTCDASAEDGTCEHVRAVTEQISEDERIGHEERQAIQEESTTTPKKRRAAAKTSVPATMTLKRSVSPDGRIDSLSVEFCCPVEQVPSREISARATNMLRLQAEIANGFLKTNSQTKQNGKGNGNLAERSPQNGTLPAKMLHVGSTNGRYGPRLFIAFQAGDKGLKLFGTAKQLAQAVSEAGYQYGEQDIAEGIYLNLPCQVITKPSRDGRYTDIERVLPSNGSRPQQRGAS
jgi:hypothetical protein